MTRATSYRLRIWLAAKILPPGWGPCVTGKANATRESGTVPLHD